MARISYASAIRSIMYSMSCTHLDVLYGLSITSRQQSDTNKSHKTVVKNIRKYFEKDYKCILAIWKKEELVVKGYIDTIFQTDNDDFRMQSGYVFYLISRAVRQKSTMHETVIDSIIEAEYIAASDTIMDVVQITKFIIEVGVVLELSTQWTLL